MTSRTETLGTRTAAVERRTRETQVEVLLALDGTSTTEIATGIGFLDHLLQQVALHGGLDLTVRCQGDLHVDDHHTAEDVALTLGQALDRALGDRSGMARFGWAYAPLEETLARAVVDLAARPFAVIRLGLERERLGALSCENVPHILRSLSAAGRFTLHVEVLHGDNDHHRAEAAFKALGLALRAAVARRGSEAASTKGVL
ncbi:MAG: imidazoleglycerol-phosphate dehydratase HisB [Thermoanaerobaculia bacterium]